MTEIGFHDEPAQRLTTWGTGAPFWPVARPRNLAELGVLVAARRGAGEPTYFIGAGSNLLLPDHRGGAHVVSMTRFESESLRFEGDRIVVGAGVPLNRLARFAAEQGRGGFGFLAGIPGTVGGGVIMNAGIGGLTGPSMADLVESVMVYDPAEQSARIVRLGRSDFRYRWCSLQESGLIVVNAAFRADRRVDPVGEATAQQCRLRERRRKQPLSARTAGSVFLPSADGKPAGALIERAGLAGAAEGSARVSFKHANWIESAGERSIDIRRLIDRVTTEVASREHVELRLEVHYLEHDACRVAGSQRS